MRLAECEVLVCQLCDAAVEFQPDSRALLTSVEKAYWRLARLLRLNRGALALPYASLMARAPKRNLTFLGGISIWMLLMHFVEVHWIVMPTVHRHGFHLHWLDLATLAAVGGVFALAFWWRLRAEPNR